MFNVAEKKLKALCLGVREALSECDLPIRNESEKERSREALSQVFLVYNIIKQSLSLKRCKSFSDVRAFTLFPGDFSPAAATFLFFFSFHFCVKETGEVKSFYSCHNILTKYYGRVAHVFDFMSTKGE